MAYGNYAPFYRTGYFNPMQPISQPMYQTMQQDNNQFAQQYQQQTQPAQPMQQPQMQVPYQAPQQPTNDMIWVQGEAGAKAYLVAPNNTVILWDSESSTIYVKSADANGIPSMRTLDFTERTAESTKMPQEHACTCGDKYVTKDDFKSLQDDFEALKGKVESLQNKKVKKVEVTDSE